MAKNGCSCRVAAEGRTWPLARMSRIELLSYSRRTPVMLEAPAQRQSQTLVLWLRPDWWIRTNSRVVEVGFPVKTHPAFPWLTFPPRIDRFARRSGQSPSPVICTIITRCYVTRVRHRNWTQTVRPRSLREKNSACQNNFAANGRKRTYLVDPYRCRN